MKLYLAPLEGVTTHLYRNTYEKYYGHIDKYFAPFISPSEDCPMTSRERKDLLPENNADVYLVPQILTYHANHFTDAAEVLRTMGYKEINLNIGCPSGTVCAKGKGAGLLKDPEHLRAFLDEIFSFGQRHQLEISLKTRLGYADPDEFYRLLEIYNEFPVSELIVHPRIKSDMYKGSPRLDYYEYALQHAKCPLVYNGNVFSKTDYDVFSKAFGSEISTVMIGRGAISNPNLAEELVSGTSKFDVTRFWAFHDSLYQQYKEVLAPDINVLYKMKELWSYWKENFDDADRTFKHIVKAKKCIDYEHIIATITPR